VIGIYPSKSSVKGSMPLMVCLFLGAASFLRAGTFDPLSVTLQPKLSISSIPVWETGSNTVPSIHPESDSVEIPAPSLSSQDEIGCFALTVVFQDNGDGGPVVEWKSNQGDLTLLSAGLGENGVALGLNARTLLLPQSLTLDGGTVRVSFAGRFSRLVSTCLRPARELGVAALGEEFKPALIEGDHQVLAEQEVSGADDNPQSGDRTDGYVIHADLATSPLRLDLPGSGNTTEFVVPLADKPVGSLLQAEVGGLDPESWIEISINGESRGILAPYPFLLNDPAVILSPHGHLQVAGWRRASVYIPARLWLTGENSVILTFHRAADDTGAPVYLKKIRADLLFSSTSTKTGTGTNSSSSPSESSETLSTGSLYGNPSPLLFHASSPTPLPVDTRP